MKKDEKKQHKKLLKQKQKLSTKKNKESAVAIQYTPVELPYLDLENAKKTQGERAYAICLVKEAVEMCQEALSTKRYVPGSMKLMRIIKELQSLSKSSTWYSYEKTKELNLDGVDKSSWETLKNVPSKYILNREQYVLNLIERSMIFMDAVSLEYRCMIAKNWGERQWKYSRCGMQLLLTNLLNGIKERQISTIHVRLNQQDEVIGGDIEYGALYMPKGKADIATITQELFDGKEWQWEKYDSNNNLIKLGNDLDDIIAVEDEYVGQSLKAQNKADGSLGYVEILERGVMFKHLGEYEQAKEEYIKAIKIDNTQPTAYYNLGKILYILGEYKASAKAYKAAYERGICELQMSMQINVNTKLKADNLYVHLGHALLDEEYCNGKYGKYIECYQRSIDPYKVQGYSPNRGQVRFEEYNEYDEMCVSAAKEYLDR